MFAYEKPEQKKASKSTIQKKEAEKPVAKPNLTGIPDTMKSQFENISGFSFDDVHVHYNSDKPAQLQALAYTQGNQVYVAPGQEKHLSHELAHVVQQKEGRVRPTINLNGFAVNDNNSLENEADNYVTIQRKQVISPNQDTIQTHSENRSGFLFNDVRAHYNSNKPVQLQELAHTQSNQVNIGTGQGKHLGQELRHIVQQKISRVDDNAMYSQSNVQKQTFAKNNRNSVDVVQCFTELKEKNSETFKDSGDIKSCIDKLEITASDIADLGIYKLFNNRQVMIEYVKNRNTTLADRDWANTEYKEIASKVDYYFNSIDSVDYSTTLPPITLESEYFLYQKISESGGGGYIESDNVVYILDEIYNRRTLLHELGHVKQKVKGGFTTTATSVERKTDRQLHEYHNIILNENLASEWEESSGFATKSKFYRSAVNSEITDSNDVGAVRVAYNKEGGTPDFSTTNTLVVKTSVIGDNKKLADAIISELALPRYTQENKITISKNLLRDCGDFFEKV